MARPVINISDVELEPRPAVMDPTGPAKERFEARMGFIGPRVGARKLGYNITAVPPGKRAFPMHNHRVNEEMFFVLKGSGEIRIGKDTWPIVEGDVIACPPGGPDSAHQIINTGDEELRYLAVSTKMTPEVVDYPDSGKFGILAEFESEKDGQPERFRFLGRLEDSRDYWEGE